LEENTTNGNINVGIEEQPVTGNAVSNHINNFKELKKFQHGNSLSIRPSELKRA
jgi:hypothetical protein